MKDEFFECDLFVSGADGVCEYRIPSLITTAAGTLLAVCDARVDRPGDAINNIDQVYKRSTDKGATWGEMRRAVAFPGEEAAGDPSMVQDEQTGRIWLFYGYVPGERPGATGPTPTRRVLQLGAVWSDDDGETWSSPRDIGAEVDRPEWCQIWPAPGRGIQAKSGRLIIPCTAMVPDIWIPRSYLTFSDDHGASWQVSACIGDNLNEPTVVELEDGTLMVNARSLRGKGCRAIVTSTDGGETWSEIRDEPVLVEPICQGSFIRLPDGKLLFSNPASSVVGDRRNMTLRLSTDDGRTWPVSRQVYEGPSRYSCLTVLPDGEIGLLYERDSFSWKGHDNQNKKICFRSFPLSWLTT